MVRAYYLRLVCWRVASVGSESGLLSSVLYANYNSDTRNLLEMRLGYTSSRFAEVNSIAKKQGLALTSSKPCSPALNRRLRIAFNPACMQPKPMAMNFTAEGILTPVGPPMVKKSNVASTRRIDPYEVFDDIAYSFPTVPVSSGMISSENIDSSFSKKNKSTSAIESLGNMIKKKWSLIRGDKRHFSKSSLQNGLETTSEYAPSLTSSSSTMSSSFIRTPGSSSSYSDARSPGSILSLTSYMNYDDDISVQSMPLTSGSPTSLTMSLIPPPPQILRKRPEILRAFYRFSLEFSEQDFEKHHQSVADRVRAKRLTGTLPPISNDGEEMVTITPLRLPFGEPFIDEYDDTYCDDSDSDFDNKEDNRAVRLEFEYTQLRTRERTRRKAADDRKYWQYAGRALNEWAGVVVEFEEYIDKCRKEAGVFRVEELAVPFMVAEIQVKSAYV